MPTASIPRSNEDPAQAVTAKIAELEAANNVVTGISNVGDQIVIVYQKSRGGRPAKTDMETRG